MATEHERAGLVLVRREEVERLREQVAALRPVAELVHDVAYLTCGEMRDKWHMTTIGEVWDALPGMARAALAAGVRGAAAGAEGRAG